MQLRRIAFGLLAVIACGDDGGPSGADTSTGQSTEPTSTSPTSVDGTGTVTGPSSDGSTGTGSPGTLVPDPGESRYAFVGEEVVLDASGSMGAALYEWDPDNGDPASTPSPDPVLTVTYDEPGRHRPVLTVHDGAGNTLSAAVTISVTFEPSHQPRQSSTIIGLPDPERVAVVSPDSDELVLIARGDDEFELDQRQATCDLPRTVADVGGRLVVACQGSDEVAVHDPTGGATQTLALPRASRPFGVVGIGDTAFVTLGARGTVAEVDISGAMPVLVREFVALPDPRGIAVLPDGRLAVSRWRSPDAEGHIALVDPSDESVEVVPLAFDPRDASDTEAGGVPTYLNQVLVSPVEDVVAIPSLQANIGQGQFLDGNDLTFETTLRGVVSFIELPGLVEDFESRKHFDNRGLLSGGVFSSRGDYLFMTDRGSRAVERFDVLARSQSGTLVNAALTPEGVALSPDDQFLYVDAFMAREVLVYDVTDFVSAPPLVASIPIVDEEPLSPELLLGKQLFNDSFDARLANDQYIACAHCHLDGESDRRTWDFTDRGEGIRNTITLLGRGGTAHGPIHWSANFDEIQDFEHDIRGPFGGLGLMTDEEFNEGTRNETLGDPKAGVSEDLDALAAYVESLDAYPRSPFRTEAGDLTADAQAGQVIFESVTAGCTTCHAGPDLTDSVFESPGVPLLHDVGTLGPGSGERLGGPLSGLDTPTLHALWNSPPYLHDGSAATIREVLTTANPGDAHGVTSMLTDEELDQLEAFLLSLEG